MIDTSGNGGTYYIISQNGNEIITTEQYDASDNVIVGDCSIKPCPLNPILFELKTIIDSKPIDFFMEEGV